MRNFAQTPAVTRVGGFGQSAATDAETAGRECVRQALAGRTPAAGDVVFIFPNATYDLEALHRGATAEAGPASVVGCTTCGAFTHETQVPLGAVAAHLVADGMSFGVCHAARDDHDIAGTTRRAVGTARERAGDAHPHSVLVLLCDGMTPDQREIARGAYEVTSAIIPLVGGAAGDDLFWRGTYTFGEDRVLSNGLLAVWINSAQPTGVAVDHGWHAHGRPMLVTRAEGATIHELDGRPAMEAYMEDLAELTDGDRPFSELRLEHPIGLPTVNGRYDLRHIHEVTREGGLTLTTGVPEQTVVQIMAGDKDEVLEGARRSAEQAVARLGGRPRMALVFSCCTRVPLLGARISEEIEAITGALGDGVPAGGFYTVGEFARVTGSAGIHNSSVAVLAL